MDNSAVEAYFSRLRDVRASGGGVKETSYYSALENLLEEVGKTLKPRVRAIFQLTNIGAGNPDGGLFTQEQIKQVDKSDIFKSSPPNRGVIEIKPASDDAWVKAESKQVTTYWNKYRQVLVTNYRDFVLVGQDASGNAVNLETYRLAAGEDDFWAQLAHPKAFAKQHGEALVEYLRRVMLHAAPLADPKDLAAFLASYARTARAHLEGEDLPALESLRRSLEEALGIRFEGDKGDHFFRSTLVQTLFYGIFSAWVLWAKGRPTTSKETFDWRTAVWSLRVPMIRALYEQIATPAHLGPLGLVEVLDWTGAVLNRVDRSAFFSAFDQGQAVQYFYEPFLEAFDPELRKEMGVWYTPSEIVEYMVARVDTVLREELGLPDGLADPNVYVLDPCCGTGSYLIAVLRRIHDTLQKNRGDALVASDVKRAAMERVFGFEILPAPFVVSHLQLGLLLQSLGSPFSEAQNERPGVYLTNALTGWEPLEPEKEKAFQAMLKGLPELMEERVAAAGVKRDKPILVVLGNPPYNAFAGVGATKEERDLAAPYKNGLVKTWGIKKFNLDDLYVRFFRMAEHRIAEQTGRGVVCYISNFSYLHDPSFVVMRQRFLSEFDRLWFDNLNGDSRETGKRTPDGKPDPSVFSTQHNKAGIRVGTAVGLLVRKAKRDPQTAVRYQEFWGVTKRTDLLESRKAADLYAQYWAVHPGKEDRYSFRPGSVSDEYPVWPRVADLSAVEPYNGPIERRGNSLIRLPDQKGDFAVLEKYLDPTVSDDGVRALEPRFMKSSGEFKAEKTRVALKGSVKYNAANIVRYPFKPFDVRLAYLDPGLAPLFSRPSPQLLEHQRIKGNAFFITRDTADKDDEGPPFYFSPCVSDYDCIFGHARHIPLLVRLATIQTNKVHEAQTHFLDQAGGAGVPIANLSASARQYLAAVGITDPEANAKTAALPWMHALAIGYSRAYLIENRDGIRQDWPRVPLPATRQLLAASAAFGEQVARLLDTEAPALGVTAGDIRPELRRIGLISHESGRSLQSNEMALTAGWGHLGKNGAVMPGQGKVLERDYSPEERAAIQEGAARLGLSLKDALACLGDRTYDIYLNDVAYWRNVPKGVWGYIIGGYQVMKKWLSYRERSILGRGLRPEEIREVTDMARRLAAILLLQPSLDANYQACRADTYPWPGGAVEEL